MDERLRLRDEENHMPGCEPEYLTKTPLPSRYIHGFFQTVYEAYDLAKQTSTPPDGAWATIVEDYPKNRQGQFDTSFNVVQWSVLDAEPAGYSKDGYDNIHTRPVIREQKPHPDKAGYILTTQAWKEWVTVEFTVYAKTNRGARETAEWFHFFIIRWAQTFDFFRMRGIEKFQFVKRSRDEETQKFGDNTLYLRRLQYKFRLEVQDQFETKTLEKLNVTVNGAPVGTLTDPRS